MSEDKALTLVPQILEAHQEVMKAGKGSLTFAIQAGEFLNLAKETVGHSKWSAWREEHCRRIPQTTASLYMRLATNKSVFQNKQRVASLEAGGDLSLRAASKLIPKDEAKAAKAKATRGANKAAKEAAARQGASTDLADLLPSLDADEVFDVMLQVKWDEEKMEGLSKRLQVYLDPAAVVSKEAGMQGQAAPQPAAALERRV